MKSCRQALKSIRSKEEIEEIACRLQVLRGELGTHVLVSLRMEVNSISTRQDEYLRALNRSTQEITKSLLESRGTVDKIHKGTVEKFEAESRFQREEHRKARDAISGRDEQRCKRQVELSLLESLRFSTMNHRHEARAEAHQRTFEWIFFDPDAEDQPWNSFVKWLEYGSGAYWINGKSGSGKSTLMRFIVDHLKTQVHLDFWAQNGCLEISSFFFWESGSLEQRSQVGLFRSLLYGVLRKHPYLISTVFAEEWRNGLELAKNDIPITLSDWSLSRLIRSFKCLTNLASSRFRLCFFIDGLDECEGDYDQIAEYFSELSRSTFVKFCVSSRPEPAFMEAFSSLPKLRLQDLTHNDIRDYIQDKLNAHKRMVVLTKADPEASTNLVLSVIERAQGVFLWVALVVKGLLKGLSNKDGISHLVWRLEHIPADLENLYSYMLTSIEPTYIEFASKTFKLLQANNLPLRLRKLYFALTTDIDRTLATPITSLQAEMAEKVRFFDIDSKVGNYEGVYDIQSLSEYMDTILQVRCGGLLEIQNYESESERGIREVEYIHRTARDYIESPIVWDSLFAHFAISTNNRFDPNMALMMSLILELKGGYTWLRKESFSTMEELFFEASSFARKMDVSNLDYQVLLLDEFERVTTELAQRKQLLPGQQWPDLDSPISGK